MQSTACLRLRAAAAVLCVRVHPSTFKLKRQHAACRKEMCSKMHTPTIGMLSRKPSHQCGRGTCAHLRLVRAHTQAAGPGRI
eukprot:2477651-Pleurochrysis_carterae.AAC.4